MLVLALIATLLGQSVPETPTSVAPVTVEADKKSAPTTLPDQVIVQQLNALRKAEPDRVVCVKKRNVDTYISRNVCSTLRQWYDLEIARDTAYVVARLKGEPAGAPPPSGPPDELVRLIKQRLKDPEARALAAERARARIEAKSSASSN